MEAGGIGWHFRGTGVPGYDAPPATPKGWTLTRASGTQVGEKGWELDLTEPRAQIASPPIALSAGAAPWLRLNWWASGLEGANPFVEWTTRDNPQFSPDRRAHFTPAASPVAAKATAAETRTMICVYGLPGWKGTITALRINFDNPDPARVVIKSFHTACDTRHNINNSNSIRGSHDCFVWSQDYCSVNLRLTGRLFEASAARKPA